MATKLLYLENFDVVSCDATVEQIQTTEDGRTDVILDQTCFYPRGGGQDWDTGNIGGVFTVEEVRLDETGLVRHIGRFTGKQFAVGDMVDCKVDTGRRSDNTRLHSAGHLLDMAMLELRPDWIPGRGAHYAHMSFVEYKVPPDTQTDDVFRAELEAKVNELAQRTYRNKIVFASKEKLHEYCRHVPDYIPTNKPTRVVLYADDFGIPCGGTHVAQLTEVGQVTIPKLKIKKQLAKVSYAVSGIN